MTQVPGTINTVLGPEPTEALGVTLMHEHVCMTNEGQFLDSRLVDDRNDRLSTAVEKLTAARDVGIDSIVDATPIDLNRDAQFLKEASEAAGINIVCSTGLYTESHGQPSYFKHMSTQELSDLFVHEITEGIGNTGVRAGVLKCASGEGGITGVEQRTFEAIAHAQSKTGVPIITHTSGGQGVEQAQILTSNGAEAGRVMIGHVDHKRSSYSYFQRIMRTGVNMAFDRCGLQVFLPDTVRAALIAGLIADGLEDRLFLSMDSTSSRIGPPSPFEVGAPEPLVYLMTDFTDLLGRYGVGPETIRSLLTANPARLFGV